MKLHTLQITITTGDNTHRAPGRADAPHVSSQHLHPLIQSLRQSPAATDLSHSHRQLEAQGWKAHFWLHLESKTNP